MEYEKKEEREVGEQERKKGRKRIIKMIWKRRGDKRRRVDSRRRREKRRRRGKRRRIGKRRKRGAEVILQ